MFFLACLLYIPASMWKKMLQQFPKCFSPDVYDTLGISWLQHHAMSESLLWDCSHINIPVKQLSFISIYKFMERCFSWCCRGSERDRDQTSPAWTHHRHGGGFPQRELLAIQMSFPKDLGRCEQRRGPPTEGSISLVAQRPGLELVAVSGCEYLGLAIHHCAKRIMSSMSGQKTAVKNRVCDWFLTCAYR